MKQAVIKTMSYAVLHVSVAVTVAYVLSGSWKVALGIGLLDPCVQIAGFFFHERLWSRIGYNKQQRANEN